MARPEVELWASLWLPLQQRTLVDGGAGGWAGTAVRLASTTVDQVAGEKKEAREAFWGIRSRFSEGQRKTPKKP